MTKSDPYPEPETFERVNWTGSPIYFSGLGRVDTPRDHDCLYHSIMNAMFIPYRTQKFNNVGVTHEQLVKMFRQMLADHLVRPDASGATPYDKLNGGSLKSFSQFNPDLSVDAMRRELLEGASIQTLLLPFVGDTLETDIYFICADNRDVVPRVDDVETIYKNRRSIVIMYTRAGYELMGVINKKNSVNTIFAPEHPFIKLLQKRIEELLVDT